MILVTAAHGNQGKALVPRLLAAGAPLRACVRSEPSARALRTAGVADVVVGDITDPDVLTRCMEGVDRVYYVGPALHTHETQMGFAAVDAARRAGVGHFVFSSVLHPQITDLVQHQSKRDIEEHLLSSGLEFTILQPANYMLRHRLLPAFERGVFRLSWSLDRHQSMVDVHDLIEVAASVLLDSRSHAGATYELVAPGRYTAHDLARVISGVTGRDVEAEQLDPDEFLSNALGVSDLNQVPYQRAVVRAIGARYSSHDFTGNANVLTWLLGRQPTTFEEFVLREFDTWQEENGRSENACHRG